MDFTCFALCLDIESRGFSERQEMYHWQLKWLIELTWMLSADWPPYM